MKRLKRPFSSVSVRETTSELRFGVSGVHSRSVPLTTGMDTVMVFDDRAGTSTRPNNLPSRDAPCSQQGTGAERTSVPARLIQSLTVAPSSAPAGASPTFSTVKSSSSVSFETSGLIKTSATRSLGRATSVTSCQMPMISPPHIEPAGMTLRPTPERSSKSFCPRTPTRSSKVSPGFAMSVTSASNGRKRSKFSATFFPLANTTHSPATASKRMDTVRSALYAHHCGTVTERLSQPIL